MAQSSAFPMLKARLSQAWLAAPLLLTVLAIAKLALLQISIRVILNTVMRIALTESNQINQTMDWVVQLPTEMVTHTNKIIESSVNNAISNTLQSMDTLVMAMESLIYFGIEMTIGTWGCLTISAVNIAANEALNATEAVVNVASKTASNVGQDINSGLNKLSKLINSVTGLLSTVESFIDGGTSEIKSINLTVSKLDNLNLSTDINTKIESLRKDVPTYNGTLTAIHGLLDDSFSLLRKQIASSNQNYTFSLLNANPEVNANNVSHINGTEITQNFAKLQHSVDKCFHGLFALCAVVIVGGILFNLYRTYTRWKRWESISGSTNPFTGKHYSEDEKQANMERFTLANQSYAMDLISTYVHEDIVWLMKYVLTRPLRDYLLIGSVGILITLIELGVVSLLTKGSTYLHKLESNSFGTLKSTVQNTYQTWQTSVNDQIMDKQNNINVEVLGWLYQGSANLNHTLDSFMTHVNDDIVDAFNNTGFLAPMQAVVSCVFGNKVETVEKALTWIHDHSQVTFPQVTTDSLVNSSSLVPPSVESGASEVFSRMIKSIKSQIYVQFWIFGSILGVWCLFLIGAILVKRQDSIRGATSDWLQRVFPQQFPKDRVTKSFEVIQWPEKQHTVQRSPNKATHYEMYPSTNPIVVPTSVAPNMEFSPPILGSAATCENPVPASAPNFTPTDKVGNRTTRFFSGPSHETSYQQTQIPSHRAQIFAPDSPRTPLRAMVFD